MPKIVIPVHFAGQSCDMKKIHSLGKEYGFKIIKHAPNLASQWMWVYDNERPHSAMGGIPLRKLLEVI